MGTWKDWDNPQSGFKVKLMKELIMAEMSISNDIEEDVTLSTEGRALVTTALAKSMSMAYLIIRFMDKETAEMLFSRYSDTKTFQLI